MATDNKQENNFIKEENMSLQTSEVTASSYSSIRVTIFLFLLITLAILTYNYIMSNKVVQITKSADLVIHQEVLVQRLAKEIKDVELLSKQKDLKQGEPISDDVILATKQLEKSVKTFDGTLNAFANGGEVVNDLGEIIKLDKVSDKVGAKSIKNAQTLWQPYKRLIEGSIISVREKNIDNESIHFASEYTHIFNAKLFREINDLEQVYINQAKDKRDAIKRMQVIAFLLMTFLFIYSLVKVLRQLANKDYQLIRTRRQTNEILATVKGGLFFINKDLVIAEQYSQSLEEILNQKELAGKTLTNILLPIVSEKDLENTKVFVEQLYSDWVLEDSINDLNPLNKLFVHIKTENDDFIERYLDFQFSRIYEGEKIVHVLVHVNDITKSVLLEQSLTQEKEQNDKQLKMLSCIINSDRNLLQYFIETTFYRIDKINNILKERGSESTELHGKLNEMYWEIHSLKGEASSLNLESFVDLAEQTESKIKKLIGTPDLVGNDFLALTIHLDELLKLTFFVDNLINRVGYLDQVKNDNVHFSPIVEATVNSQPDITMKEYYTQFAQELAQCNGKEVSLQCIGMDSVTLTTEQQNLIKDISIQLLRNAIIHGIELPNERVRQNKSRVGKLTLRLEENHDIFILSMTDDGQGINYDKIRQTALECGKYNPEIVESWTKKDLLRLLFTSKKSTSDILNEDSGHGVGMDIIKTLVKQLGGRLKIGSKENRYSRFTITFPHHQQFIVGL